MGILTWQDNLDTFEMYKVSVLFQSCFCSWSRSCFWSSPQSWSRLNFQTYEASKPTENISEIFFFSWLACLSKTFLKNFVFVFHDLLASRKHLWNILFLFFQDLLAPRKYFWNIFSVLACLSKTFLKCFFLPFVFQDLHAPLAHRRDRRPTEGFAVLEWSTKIGRTF